MPEKTRATLGGCQRFECRVIGYPRPTIQWFKDGRDITNDSRYEFDYLVDGIITMVICNVTEKDQGVYSCRAENSEGWAATAAFLNVRGRDLFPFLIRFCIPFSGSCDLGRSPLSSSRRQHRQ